jgi:anti-sigma factor RsiW
MSDGATITCREMVELVTDYLEGALPEEDRERFERHLAGCDACTAYMEQFRLTVVATGRVEEEDIDPPMRAELLAAFRGWRGAGS